MPDESALDTLLKRDRLLMIIGMGILTILAWGYMFYDAHRMAQGRSCCSALAKASLHHWPVSDLLLMFVMWTVMMIAMMVPSAAPMVLMFSSLSRKRRAESRPYLPASLFLFGYLLIWTGFSAVVTIAQWCLHATALLSPKMVSTSSYFAGALLIAAGVFQFTPLKHACLKHCCSPMQFLMTRRREGRIGALRTGFDHGLSCTGCCWLLMALLFVAGVMNLLWVAAITLFVLVEKVVPRSLWITRAGGLVAICWGFVLLLQS